MVFSMVSALSPGYCAIIAIEGGAIFGYCSIGKLNAAIRPHTIIPSEITVARMGRFINNLIDMVLLDHAFYGRIWH
jgi:hypothetical protein